jgi:hypothetical protein
MADDLTLEYYPTLTTDYLLEIGAAKSGYTLASPTLAVRKSGAVLKEIRIHFSSEIQVKRGLKNVSGNYGVKRGWRGWARRLDPNDREQATEGYGAATQGLGVDAGDDYAIGKWKDAPFFMTGTRQQEFLRTHTEWVVAARPSYTNALVDGLKGIYFFSILDLTPTHYRYRLSSAFELTLAQTQDIFGNGHGSGPLPANGPWKTEDDVASNAWAARSPDWISYAAYNNQLPLPTP